MELGQTIQRLRLYKGITHLDMMETLEVSQATYSRIETGKKEITNELLQKIADKMGMTPEEIIEEAGKTIIHIRYNKTDGNGSSNGVVYNQASPVEKELYDKLIAEKDKQIQEKNELLTQQAEQIKVLQEHNQRLTERLLELR